MNLSRRDFGRLALAAVPATALGKIDSTVNGVKIGAQTYSFRDRSLEEAIEAMKQIGLGCAELFSGHAGPYWTSPREEVRTYRLTVSMDKFRQVRRQFDNAGIELFAYSYDMKDDFTDEEIARGFEMAKALGVTRMTSSSNTSTVARIYPHAAKAGITVGMHNHSRIAPNEFARPEDFEQAMRGRTPYIGVNFDIGHFWAANFDPVSFIEKHHEHILSIHLKDRKKNDGPNMPFGQGGTPVREVLRLLKANKYPIPAMIEYEYKGEDTVTEVRRCFDYCKNALA
jgi:sugar phosphate isomerase/epimerase